VTWRRVAALGLVLWIVGLAVAVQPHPRPAPTITHSQLLDKPVHDLPTLSPSGP
jgi:hypothetical protein